MLLVDGRLRTVQSDYVVRTQTIQPGIAGSPLTVQKRFERDQITHSNGDMML